MLRDFIARLPVVDQHVHNVVEGPGNVPLHHILAETSDTTVLEDHVPHTLCYLRTLQDLAELYGCTPDQVESVRRTLPINEMTKLCYKNVHALLIDDGYTPSGQANQTVQWHAQHVPVAKRIFRIEIEALKLLQDLSNPAYDSISGVAAAVRADVAANRHIIVGLKSISCYRTGLAIDPTTDFATVEKAYAALREEVRGRIAKSPTTQFRETKKTPVEKIVIDYLVVLALEMAIEYDIPLQFHTGFGDTDMQLSDGNPTHLKAILDLEKFRKAKIVLLHSSYPYSREAGYLASVYPQVYLDVGLAIPRLSVDGMLQAVGQLLELCPISKLLFSSDGTVSPEMCYIGVKWSKYVVTELLNRSVANKELTVDQATDAARKIFFENAVALYHLTPPQISLPPSISPPLAIPEGVQLVRLVWCGNDGLLRAKCVHVNALAKVQDSGVALTSAVQGLMAFADVLVPNCGLTSSEDIWMIPDLSTLKQLPHHPKHAMALVQLRDLNGKTTLCPRSAAQRQIDLFKELGLGIFCGFENEFNLYDSKNEPVDGTSYCQTYAMNLAPSFLDDLVESITAIGAPLWLVHPEACIGQFELSLTKLPALEAADKQLFLREIIKGVAVKHGYQPCFLPKPFEMQAGNGAHLHLSLWKGEANLTKEFPPLVKHFLAGILAHLDGILAITCATVNSYARMTPSCWAGIYSCWGIDNKEAAIRLCTSPDGYSNVELKTVDPTATPHLALAVVLAAGLDGIRRELELPPPVHGDPHNLSDDEKVKGHVRRLPSTLGAALDAFEADQVLVDALGARQAKAYVAVKRAHVAQFQAATIPEFVQTFRTKF
ncbi:hypothetical protein LEN26_014190 [Aphanomyces euteiches]|nr:hypothetical protein LEN26_014190 [Aphanomyces euteiches]